ncbi:MAG: aminoglycoside phosphotransferase family protein [Chloroflexota bacterium]|nr:aminoglycoside phosphotransferase family protein [Chloroflexota bacterium]
MLAKPEVPNETLLACLRDHFRVHATEIAFLPLGNDVDTAVYQVVADDATPYFLKLRSWRRSGRFDATTVTIPRFLHDQGITQIIASIPTRERQLWTRLDAFAVILFPFIAGRNGFAAPLSERQWIEFGAALKKVHTVVVPPTLNAQLPYETYAPLWRDRVRALQARVEETAFTDPIAAELAAFLCAKHDDISHLIARAATLGDTLRARPPAHVLCHADIHAANLLIGTDGALYIVDWDTLILAPKERDLMFIGGGVGGAWNTTQEEALFYRGYGQTEIDRVALAYYRFERIVEDIVEFCERLLLTDEGGENRAVGLGKFVRQFGPNNVVEIACRTDMGL